MNATNTGLNVTEPSWIYVAVHVTCVSTFVIGFPINLAIIGLVVKRRPLRNSTNFFVASLALADILVLLWMLVWVLGINTFPTAKTFYQYICPSLDIFLSIASIFNVTCVSLDRALAVTYPLRYENKMTRVRSFKILCFCWSLAFSILIAALLRIIFVNETYNKVVLYLGFISYFIPVLIITLCYSAILLVVVQQIKGIERVIYSSTSDKANKRRRSRNKLLQELKITGNVLSIVLPFSFGWTFFIATHIYEATKNRPITDMGHNFAIIVIPWILSGLNPVLYMLLTRPLRRAFINSMTKLIRSDKYAYNESKTSLLLSISRRASSVFRRASSSVDDGSDSLKIGSGRDLEDTTRKEKIWKTLFISHCRSSSVDGTRLVQFNSVV